MSKYEKLVKIKPLPRPLVTLTPKERRKWIRYQKL